MQPNTIAAALIAVYLALVLTRGREKELTALLLSEGDFLKWFLALVIVLAVADELGNAGKALIALVYAAMALQAIRHNKNVFDNLSNVLTIK
jgi:cell division protein FtsW (lipid II flippase)